MRPINRQLNAEIARAEAVVASANGNYKLHEPTIDNHRGQLIAYSKVKSLLEHEEQTPNTPIRIEKHHKITITWPAIVGFAVIFVMMLW